MKKIVSVLILTLFFISCSPDSGDSYSLEILPVAKVEMQTAFRKDSVTEIPVKYLRPSNCYFYEDFYYVRNEFTRVVAIYNSKLNKDNCQTLVNDTVMVPLKFKPATLGTYTFKFWKGVNASGQDEFFEYEAIVNH
jgi:hypothetical protein